MIIFSDAGSCSMALVLDDPVVHDRDAPLGIGEGMRVALGGLAVGRPARVADPGGRLRQAALHPPERAGDQFSTGNLGSC